MQAEVVAPRRNIAAEIALTASKSESNRVLIIRALCDDDFDIIHLAKAKDTETLRQILLLYKTTNENVFDVGPAGTTFRFLTTLFAITAGTRILTGSERMKERPVGELVEVLNGLGASICYKERPGYPPLLIKGNPVKGGTMSMRADVSSQFVSALMMVAPALEYGLTIQFSGNPVSYSYIEMTASIMREFGAKVDLQQEQVIVLPGKYRAKPFVVESDWSAASYWYAVVALSESAEVFLSGLKQYSLQGDARLAEIFFKLGVITIYEEEGVIIKKGISDYPPVFRFDFENCPDIAQTVIVVCCALKISFEFSGLRTLKIKETDRISAMINECAKFGSQLVSENDDCLKSVAYNETSSSVVVQTYHDHRMAMAFAPWALKREGVFIDQPQVVEKSYPDFWKDLESAGFFIRYTSEKD